VLRWEAIDEYVISDRSNRNAGLSNLSVLGLDAA